MALWLLKFFTSAIALGAFPDLISQKITRSVIDWRRTMFMAIVGGINGAVMVEGFYRILGHYYGQEEWIPRILWDQLCFSPLSTTLVMISVYTLYQYFYKESGISPWVYWRRNYPLAQGLSWLYWTPAASSIYIYLPDMYKLFGQNIYAFFWGMIMSVVMHRKEKKQA